MERVTFSWKLRVNIHSGGKNASWLGFRSENKRLLSAVRFVCRCGIGRDWTPGPLYRKDWRLNRFGRLVDGIAVVIGLRD